jgi:hypothetical protein
MRKRGFMRENAQSSRLKAQKKSQVPEAIAKLLIPPDGGWGLGSLSFL